MRMSLVSSRLVKMSFVLALALLPLVAGYSKTFIVPHVDGQDDSPAVAAALATGNYTSDSLILFQKGVTYNLWTVSIIPAPHRPIDSQFSQPIKFHKMRNSEIAFEGNISYPKDIATIQAEVAKPVCGALRLEHM